MADIVVMPKLGLLMETGVVSEWRVAEGDAVSVGDVIAEVTTEKITYELEAQGQGVLLKILLPEEEEAAVGAPIAVIGRPGEDLSDVSLAPSGEEGPGLEAAATAAPIATAVDAAPAAGGAGAPGGRVVASPAAKKLAAEAGIDLAAVLGTGPGGRITLEDVNAAAARTTAGMEAKPVGTHSFATPVAKKIAAELGVGLGGVAGSGVSGRIRAADVAAAARPPAAAAPSTGAPIAAPSAGAPITAMAVELRGGVAQEISYAGMRRLIGEHMDASRRLAPMVTYYALADVEDAKHLLTRVNVTRTEDNKINITGVVIKAVALTLKMMPRFNASLDGDVIKVWRSINIGVAVALTDGLIVPVIREADRKSISDIAREVRDLAGRARENRLLPDEVSGGTFTVTTLGPYRSVDFFNPIINQPEAAILGVGRMQDTVAALDGAPKVRAAMGLSLTCDHRMLDGAPAAQFLRTLMDYLADPFSIFSLAI
ncbi:MAG: 2-oxo acid dehydrogenase subunit E2 [Thermoleophilia bacterium]|nr:2-oxo acid dehydrogenase subunit E2 [Thermoleophilia bacterium]